MRKYRAVFLSDLHLGTRWCQAEALAAFLSSFQAERLYLVGDIIDGWKLKRRSAWPQAHNNVVRKLLKLSKHTKICYVTGNHDDFLDEFNGYFFGNIEICRKAVHVAGDGRRYAVVHGDEYDIIVKYKKWVAVLGDLAYDAALWMNAFWSSVRALFRLPYWSLSTYLKHKVKDAVNYIGDFEEALLREARKSRVDGIICGHLHKPALRRMGPMVYANCGDWVESCTAVAEREDGSLELLFWHGRGDGFLPVVTGEGELLWEPEVLV